MLESILYYTLPSLAFTLLVGFLVRPKDQSRIKFAFWICTIESAVAFKYAYATIVNELSKYPVSLTLHTSEEYLFVIGITVGFVTLAVLLPNFAAAFCAPDVFSRSKSAGKSSTK